MRVFQKQGSSLFSQTKVYTFSESVRPVPLASNNFNSQHRLSYQVIISENQGQAWQSNKTYNNAWQNSPNLLQTSMMIESFRNRTFCMMKSIYNTEDQPQNQKQNNNLEKLNVSIQVCNTLSHGSSWVLEVHLPRNWRICISFKLVKKEHRKHLLM